jgi:hypothetical protein
MSFAQGDIVQVVNERSRYHGQVGAILKNCVCPAAALGMLLVGQHSYEVAIDGGTCFLEKSLRKLGERPELTNVETPEELTA